MRHCWAIILIGFMLLPRAGAEMVNYIAAVVNEKIITFRELEEIAGPSLEGLRRTAQNHQVFERKATEIMRDTLEQLIEKQLILDDFKSAGGKLPDSIIDDEINERIRQRFGDRMTLAKTLKAEGMTFDTFRQRTHDEIVVGYMRQKNVSSAIMISPHKIEQYYSTNQTRYQLGDQVHLRMIVLNRPSRTQPEETRTLAQEILTKINEGASFKEMAAIYSEGSERRQAGDWGWVESSTLNKGLAEVAFNLNPGQHSPVLALARIEGTNYWMYEYDQAGRLTSARKYSDAGDVFETKNLAAPADAGFVPPAEPNVFYLMQVEEKRPAHTRQLAEVRDEIERELILQERARLQRKWIDRLRVKAFVSYF